MTMLSIFEAELDTVDASIFTGDALGDPKARAMLREFMERWERAAAAAETNHTNEDDE